MLLFLESLLSGKKKKKKWGNTQASTAKDVKNRDKKGSDYTGLKAEVLEYFWQSLDAADCHHWWAGSRCSKAYSTFNARMTKCERKLAEIKTQCEKEHWHGIEGSEGLSLRQEKKTRARTPSPTKPQDCIPIEVCLHFIERRKTLFTSCMWNLPAPCATRQRGGGKGEELGFFLDRIS